MHVCIKCTSTQGGFNILKSYSTVIHLFRVATLFLNIQLWEELQSVFQLFLFFFSFHYSSHLAPNLFYIRVPWYRMTCKNELIKNVPTIPLKPWSPALNECNTLPATSEMALDLSQWVTFNLISTPFVAMHDAIIIHLISSKIPFERNNVKITTILMIRRGSIFSQRKYPIMRSPVCSALWKITLCVWYLCLSLCFT